MSLSPLLRSLRLVIGLVVLIIAAQLCLYRVSEQEQVIITQFGRPVGQPVRKAGLHFKLPLIQAINRIDKRILEWDGRPGEMPTRDKLYSIVDTFGRWRISEPLLFFTRMRDERSALSRLDDIIGSEVRNAVAKHDLIEIVRTDKNRKPALDTVLGLETNQGTVFPPISRGRMAIEREIVQEAAPKLKDFGIELVDVRFMRINYNPRVSSKIHERMISEREQIASRFRSEGEGEAAKILGNKERDLQQIQSQAYREVQRIRGQADAKAAEIYALAYNQSPVTVEFYGFLRAMETYRKSLSNDCTLILSTDSDLFRYLKTLSPRRGAGE